MAYSHQKSPPTQQVFPYLDAQSNVTMEYGVNFPEDSYAVLEAERDDLPAVIVVNLGLRQLEPKIVFGWHLSLNIMLQDLAENGMPTSQEVDVLDEMLDDLQLLLNPADQKPNALFLARVTWNGMREIMWRVHDPELANATLQEVISSGTHRREFEFEMEHDPEWLHAEQLLEAAPPSDYPILDN